MRQSACLVFNPIMVDNYAAFFNCTPVGRASDSMFSCNKYLIVNLLFSPTRFLEWESFFFCLRLFLIIAYLYLFIMSFTTLGSLAHCLKTVAPDDMKGCAEKEGTHSTTTFGVESAPDDMKGCAEREGTHSTTTFGVESTVTGSNCEANHRICFRYTDSTIPLLLQLLAV